MNKISRLHHLRSIQTKAAESILYAAQDAATIAETTEAYLMNSARIHKTRATQMLLSENKEGVNLLVDLSEQLCRAHEKMLGIKGKSMAAYELALQGFIQARQNEEILAALMRDRLSSSRRLKERQDQSVMDELYLVQNAIASADGASDKKVIKIKDT